MTSDGGGMFGLTVGNGPGPGCQDALRLASRSLLPWSVRRLLIDLLLCLLAVAKTIVRIPSEWRAS